METTEPSANADLVGLSGAIVSAYVSHNALSPGALPELFRAQLPDPVEHRPGRRQLAARLALEADRALRRERGGDQS